MISSSTERRGPPAVEPGEEAPAGNWTLTELEEIGPGAIAAAREERHRSEVEAAYLRGFNEGQTAGEQAARDELRVPLHAALTMLEEVRAGREAWQARLQERLVVLAAAMAQKVIERTRAEDESVFVDLATKAVAQFPVEEPVRIRLHPTDHALVTRSDVLQGVVGDRAVRWVPDDDVVPGGCVVEGPDRIVDGRVDEALVRIVLALTHG